MSNPPVTSRRQTLLSIYLAALQSVEGGPAVSRYLANHPLQGQQWAVVAIGKAAASMAHGAQCVLGASLHSGLVITKYGYGDPRLSSPRWRAVESGHPIPDENSLVAGEALLEYIDALPDELPLLFLLSGGASALVEVLPGDMSLAELERINNWLLGSGLAIGQINAIRKRLSRLKGGRLARHLRSRRCLQLLISDVPGDDPASIGSAPLYPCRETTLPQGLPLWLQQRLAWGEPFPAADDPAFSCIDTRIIASNARAREAAAAAAHAMGLAVIDHPAPFQGPAERLAAEFVDEMVLGNRPGLYLWGGESSVVLPPYPGRGGRNQHLALAAARRLVAVENCLFLAAATDGSDGPTGEAGALVDGWSVERGEAEGLSAERALHQADSGKFLEASGDLVETGPTGTNVMDLVIGWSWHAD